VDRLALLSRPAMLVGGCRSKSESGPRESLLVLLSVELSSSLVDRLVPSMSDPSLPDFLLKNPRSPPALFFFRLSNSGEALSDPYVSSKSLP
jgi:hypothetical protein